MTKDNLKELEKLAKLCRKIGIKTFRNDEIEFTLADYEPIRRSRSSNKEPNKYKELEETINERPLTEEEMLYWSSSALGETESSVN